MRADFQTTFFSGQLPSDAYVYSVDETVESSVCVLIVLADADESSVYPELLFLGTGSAMPNKVRNVSAILLNLRYAVVTPLDCHF